MENERLRSLLTQFIHTTRQVFVPLRQGRGLDQMLLSIWIRPAPMARVTHSWFGVFPQSVNL